MSSRYALYAAPPAGDTLHNLAARWLGWDAESGIDHAPALPGFDPAEQATLTAEPRLYGFHGTLKPPFRLAPGQDIAALDQALTDFAVRRPAIVAPPLQVTQLGAFLALRPAMPCAVLDELAADCVQHFDGFRAPLNDTELAKRRAAGLSARQETYLAAWGYPYVLEEFRLHFTLTGRIADAVQRTRIAAQLTQLFAPALAPEFRLEDICLFEQPLPGAPFRLRRRYRLAAEL